MRKRSKKQWAKYIGITAAAIAVFFGLSVDGIAAGNTTASSTPASGDAAMASDAEDGNAGDLPAANTNENGADSLLTVQIPVIAEGEPSPFDFFLDPCGLLYETSAIRYGGGTVEEGATMLFCNRGGEYDFSKNSDKLSITNQSGDSVMVTISASLSDLEGIEVIGQDDFSGNENPAIYLAMTDDRGNVQPISAEGKAIIRAEVGSGVYSFGLTGACNPNAQWQGVSVHPKVTVTWHVEPVSAESKPETEAEEKPEEEAETEPEEEAETEVEELGTETLERAETEPEESETEIEQKPEGESGTDAEERPEKEPEESETQPEENLVEEPGTETEERLEESEPQLEKNPVEEQGTETEKKPAEEPGTKTEESPKTEPEESETEPEQRPEKEPEESETEPEEKSETEAEKETGTEAVKNPEGEPGTETEEKAEKEPEQKTGKEPET